MQLYLEEQVKFYETVKAFLSTISHTKLETLSLLLPYYLGLYKTITWPPPAIVFMRVLLLLLHRQIAEKLRQAHSQFTTIWKHRPSVSHYKTRRVKPAQHPQFSCLDCLHFPPFNLNFYFSPPLALTSYLPLLLMPTVPAHVLLSTVNVQQLTRLCFYFRTSNDSRTRCAIYTNPFLCPRLAACGHDRVQTCLCSHFICHFFKIHFSMLKIVKQGVYICCLHSDVLTPTNQSHPPLCH